MEKQTRTFLAALGSLAVIGSSALADSHVTAGANASSQLVFVDGGLSSTTYHMVPEATGRRYAGYYALGEQPRTQFPNEYFSFIALSDGTGGAGIEEPGHASTGADLWLEISSVEGPAGATFGFWESGWAYDVNNTNHAPSRSFLTNMASGGFKFEISEPLSFLEPEEQDPYGHIHERGWTVDQPGHYFIGFTLYDLSTVGPGGGPIHTKSKTYSFHFLAVPEPGGLSLLFPGLLLLAAVRLRPGGTAFAHPSRSLHP